MTPEASAAEAGWRSAKPHKPLGYVVAADGIRTLDLLHGKRVEGPFGARTSARKSLGQAGFAVGAEREKTRNDGQIYPSEAMLPD